MFNHGFGNEQRHAASQGTATWTPSPPESHGGHGGAGTVPHFMQSTRHMEHDHDEPAGYSDAPHARGGGAKEAEAGGGRQHFAWQDAQAYRNGYEDPEGRPMSASSRGPSSPKPVPRSVQRALLMQQGKHRSRYRCGKST